MRPPSLGKRWHVAFTDPAGGSGSDSFTLAVAHRENDQGGPRYVLDCLLERKPPFGPDAVIAEFSQTIKAYNCHKVTGDKWAQGFPPESFKRHGVSYEISEKTKSDLYLTALPLLTSGLASLLDDKRLISQLTALERRTSRGGKDSIDHPPSGHDDLCNAAMGALVQAMGRRPMQISDAALALAGSETRYARQLRDVARLQRGEIDGIPAAWL
jgi:hypothetical protein